jgi:integrase
VSESWESAWKAWLASTRQQSGAGNTERAYRLALRQLLEFVCKPAALVGPADAQAWAAHLSEALAPGTVALKLAAASSFYRWVRDNEPGLWPAERLNPFLRVKRPRVTAYGRATYPTTAQVQRLLGAVNTTSPAGRRDFALLYLLVTTCRRSSEILNLRWGDIRDTPAGWAFHYRYKGGLIRQALMPPQGRAALVAYLLAAGRDPERMAPEEFVFAPIYPGRAERFRKPATNATNCTKGNDGRPISNQQANQILWRWGRKAGLPREVCHVHGLRHAGARLRIQLGKAAGAPLDTWEVMRLLGHASLAVTQVYTDAVLEDPVDPGGTAAAAFLLGRRGL